MWIHSTGGRVNKINSVSDDDKCDGKEWGWR